MGGCLITRYQKAFDHTRRSCATFSLLFGSNITVLFGSFTFTHISIAVAPEKTAAVAVVAGQENYHQEDYDAYRARSLLHQKVNNVQHDKQRVGLHRHWIRGLWQKHKRKYAL